MQIVKHLLVNHSSQLQYCNLICIQCHISENTWLKLLKANQFALSYLGFTSDILVVHGNTVLVIILAHCLEYYFVCSVKSTMTIFILLLTVFNFKQWKNNCKFTNCILYYMHPSVVFPIAFRAAEMC